ncbi:two-partner secretion domain-containing protein [Erwinia pyrifoliae]|uniref:two-partner secretion domain-containing protein n=1 Tax=Erwinia pyrifoliae TaxID=79967 RepID=UPI00223BB479|nr:filamentous hemagglutinin N-terminal domain-containing protein [Erwinia pyrifoliae]MCT2387452.1 filamentous hemagglutinin N-terminal domain-containing protein [Erwinia pyrifoliae]MCU8585707.1 filamentous hemagglutinin N-terminal domain-containing protein [Erwinia pyrifoliae]
MNKPGYRLILRRTRGERRALFVPARSGSNPPGQRGDIGAPRPWVTVRRWVWLLAVALFDEPAVADGIVADGAAGPGQRPEVIATHNGLLQVNITAPNQAGISHNQYQQFDVDLEGTILNNSATMASTQMAGVIQGNPNLNSHSAPARVILNEVNSNNPSQLRGFMEVAGGRAQVIVANPAGIMCNGCGTINAGRMTLTTGKPQLNADGSLAGYRIERGVVRIEGGGLNGDPRHDTEYVDVLARAVKVNAGVWAKKELNVAAGRNDVSADGKQVTAHAANGKAPELAIDMGQLGGMYSGHIRMIGTEAGVGVRNRGGHLQADKTLSVSSEGKLVWQAADREAVTRAGGNIGFAARDDIEHHGKLHSGGTLSVASRSGDLKQSGTLAAAGDVLLHAGQGIHSSGHLLAGSNATSQLMRTADLTLTSEGDIRASGSLLSHKDINLNGRRVDISQSQLAASRATLSAQSGGVALRQTKVDSGMLAINTAGNVDAQQAHITAGQWDVTGNSLFSQKAVWSQTGGAESRFVLNYTLDNSDGSITARQLALRAAAVINQHGQLVALAGTAQHWWVGGLLNNNHGELGSNGDLSLDVGSLNNQSGNVKSQSALHLTAGGAIANARGSLLAGKQLRIHAVGALDNSSGTINGGNLQTTTRHINNEQGQLIGHGELSLTAREGLDNQHGLVDAGGKLTVYTDGDWDNRGGTAESDTQLFTTAHNVDNGDGKLLSGQQLTLNASGKLENRSGEISGEQLAIATQRLGNVQGKVIGLHSLSLNAVQALNNAQGLLSAGEVMNAGTTGQMDNRGGTVQGGCEMTLAAQDVDNEEGKLLSGQQLTLAVAGTLRNRNGAISGEKLNLSAGRLDNPLGRVIALEGLNLLVQQALDNRRGLLEAGGALVVHTDGDWDNRGGAAQGGSQVNVSVRHLNNAAGRLQSGGELVLNSTGDISNQRGILTAQQGLNWQGGSGSGFDNDAGLLQSAGNLSLLGGRFSNRQQGWVLSQQALSLNLAGVWDNQGGTLTGNGRTLVRAAGLNNGQGAVNILDSLDMQFTDTLDNGSGRIYSKRSQTLRARHMVNTRGSMGSQGSWRAVSDDINNHEGVIQSQQDATLAATVLDNGKGVMQSAGALDLHILCDIDNRAGKMRAQGPLTLQGPADGTASSILHNVGGQLLSADTLTVAAQGLDNRQGGLLDSQKQMRVALKQSLDNRQGRLRSGSGLQLDARSLLNTGGSLDSQRQLGLRIMALLDNAGGSIRSNGGQQVTARQVSNRQGVFSSGDALNVTVAQLDNAGGTLISQGIGVYRTDTLHNQQGKVHSGDALTLNAARVYNRAGQLISTRALTLNTAQLDNSGQGTLSSQAGLEVQADLLNNRDGGTLHGTLHIGVTARAVDNRDGRLQSAGLVTLAVLSTLDNRQGRIQANGAVRIHADAARTGSILALLNQGGRVQSGETLSLYTRTLDNQGGTLQSRQALTLTVQQNYTHRTGDTLSSNGALNLTVTGVLTNLTEWLLPGSLTVNSHHLTNQGSLVGQTLQLTTGRLFNQGRLEAGRMVLDIDTLDNPATVMGDDITVRARIIDNHGRDAVMAAAAALHLENGERLNNSDGALLYSGGRLYLGSSDLIENRASFIEAGGDATVEARRPANLNEGREMKRDAEKSAFNWHRHNFYWRSNGTGDSPDKLSRVTTTWQLPYRGDAVAQYNRYGTLLAIDASGKRAQVRVKDNKGQLKDRWVNYLTLTPNADGGYAITFYETHAGRHNVERQSDH